jgi:aconitate hydratase
MPSQNSFGAAGELLVGGRSYKIYRLAALEKAGVQLSRIPYSIKVLLENLLRFEDGLTVKKSDIEYVAQWDPSAPPREINFRPARVLGQSADPGGFGDRPFGAGGQVRHRRFVRL